MTIGSDSWQPAASLENLRRRAELLRRLRAFFDDRGFVEVETPLLSADSVVDVHLDPLPVTLFDDPRQPAVGRRMWLQTSPEFAMKRLLAAGATAIYQVTRAFRGGERGPWHNPEFTMVEWYRVGDGLDQGMDLLAELASRLLPGGAPRKQTYAAAFQEHAGLDPHAATAPQLAETARRLGISAPESLTLADRDAWLDLLLVDRVQPRLGLDAPVLIHDYPASQAALAQIRPGEPPVAERFELFYRGVELANGYHELRDPEVLRVRIAAANRQRAADGRYRLPESSRLLETMERGLPPAAGVALGFDRFAVLALGLSRIDEVMAFPIEIA